MKTPYRRFGLFYYVILVVMVTAVVETGFTDASMGPPKPSPEVSKLNRFFAPGKKARCEGTSYPPGYPAHAVKGESTNKMDLNGFWLFANYHEIKTKENPMPYSVHEYYSFDAINKVFVRSITDSMGAHASMTAPLTDGYQLVFSGDYNFMGKKIPSRATFVAETTDKLSVTVEAMGPDGKWGKTVELSCKH
jgi:hypothetical protein